MPEFGALFAAVAALLIIWSWQSWTVKVLQQFKAHSPGLFGPLFDALIAADTAIYNGLRGWADLATQPFSALLDRVIATADAFITNPVLFARNVYNALQRLFTVTVPNAIATAETTAQGLFRQAEQAAQALAQAAEQELAGLAAEVASLPAQFQDLRQLLIGFVVQVAQQVEAYAQSLVSGVEQEVAQVGGEVRAVVDAEQTLAAEAEAAARAFEASLANEAARFESQLGLVAGKLESEVVQARGELGAEIVQFEDLVKARVEAAVDAFPNALLGRLSTQGREDLVKDVEAMVTVSLAHIRREIKDVDALRARYAPMVQAEIDKLKARL